MIVDVLCRIRGSALAPALLVGLVLLACGGPRARMLDETDAEGETALALQLIAELPSWWKTRPLHAEGFAAADVRAYVDTAQTLRGLDPENLRAAYVELVAWLDRQDAGTRREVGADLYVLDRILFAVPDGVPSSEARYFADHARPLPPQPMPAVLNLRWPVVLDAQGAVLDIEPMWTGPALVGPYRALEAFDHRRATYGFREDIRFAGSAE